MITSLSGKFVVRRVGLAMINLHTKFCSLYVYPLRRYERQRKVYNLG